MSWNVVLNKFIEIKNAFINKYGVKELYGYDIKKETCLDYWCRKLNNDEFNDLIKPLQLNEHNDLLLIRYGNYANVFGGEEDVTYDEFWDLYDGFYLECRSVVINIKKDELALTPFKKFRNINECEETSFNNVKDKISQAKCVEFSNKLDGSMQSARWYDNSVLMAGSMALNTKDSWRLEDGYKMIAKGNYAQMLKDFPSLTFIFEYISLKDSHVVKYTKDEEGLYLIGIRDTSNGYEYSYKDVLDIARKYCIKTTELFNKTLDVVMSELDTKKSNEAEGFVLNIDGFKVKIKYNDYVNMHHVLSAMSSINLIIKNIADNTFDDMLSKVPQAYRDRVLKVSNFVFNYIKNTNKEIDEYYNTAPKIDKKNFMIWVNDNVPINLKGYVRAKYLGNQYNVIKTGTGKYLRLKDMGMENYSEVFDDGE